MTAIDPFASAPDEAQAAPETAPAPEQNAPTAFGKPIGSVKVKVEPDFQGFNDSKVVLTFKGGTGFDAPWIVIHATDLKDAHAQITGDNANLLAEVMTQSQKAGAHFAGLAPAKASPNSSNAGAAPAASQQAPAGSPEPPAGWTYKTGVGKNGKVWKAFMPPRGDDSQPIWL